MDKNSSIFREEPTTTATTAKASEVWPFILSFLHNIWSRKKEHRLNLVYFMWLVMKKWLEIAHSWILARARKLLSKWLEVLPVGLRTSEDPMGNWPVQRKQMNIDYFYLLMNGEFSEKFSTHCGKTRCTSPWDIWVAITVIVRTKKEN